MKTTKSIRYSELRIPCRAGLALLAIWLLVQTSALGAVSTTVLAVSPSPSVYGQAVIFTATVTGGSGTATGTITWSNATTTTSFFTNTLSAGVAKYTNCVLDVGVSTIVATYSGDGTYSGSAASTNQTVNLADTVTTLSSSTNPSVWGQNIVFTARVTNTVASCEIPTSTVSLYDGVTSLGFQSVDGSGVATFNLSSLGVDRKSTRLNSS